MRTKFVCIAATALLVAGIPSAWAEEIEVNTLYSGSYVKTPIDVNGDFAGANSYLVWAKGSPGRHTIRGVYETVTLGSSATCPAPLIEIQRLYSTYVARFENGDLLFARSPAGSPACADLSVGAFQGTLTYDVIGGTGRFHGATGTIEDHVTFVFLLQNPIDPANMLPFGALFGTQTGTICTIDD
jgi:hypothetical protein